jgi:glycosyltransferase involved in cell wall biosynthesis
LCSWAYHGKRRELKVLVSSYQCVPNQGSELGNGWNWARALADEGHQVTVVTKEPQSELGTSTSDIEFLSVPPSESRTQKTALRLGSVGRQAYTLSHYIKWQSAAAEYIHDHHRASFDVVHHVAWGSLHLGSGLWRLDAPLVYGPIGGGQVAPADYWRYFGREWPVEMARTLATRSLLKFNSRCRETIHNAAVVLVTNSDTAQVCRELGGQDVRYMLAEGLPPQWISAERSRPSGLPTVLWVGRFLPRKAPTLAVEAFAELRSRVPARLVMAGTGPLFEKTRSRVRELGLEADVEMLGHVPWREITELYDSATVFLFSSLRDSSGSQFLEALGRGLPAVALDHHGVGETDVGIAAVKVPLPEEPAELPRLLGGALLDVVTDDGWAERSAAGVTWAAQHTWPAKAAIATKVYADAVSASSVSPTAGGHPA